MACPSHNARTVQIGCVPTIEQQAKKLALKAFFKNYNIEVSNEVLTILSSIDIPLVTSPTKMIEIIEKIYNSEIKDIVEKLKNQLS